MEDWQSLFLDLLKANYGRWRMIARSYAAAESDDLLQEILLQIWKSLPSFCKASAPGTWCYRVALNTALSWRRADLARRKQIPVGGSADTVPAIEATANHEPMSVMDSLMLALSPTDRAILLLTLDDVSYADMAAILGSTEGALRVRVHRIKQRLTEMAREVRDEL